MEPHGPAASAARVPGFPQPRGPGVRGPPLGGLARLLCFTLALLRVRLPQTSVKCLWEQGAAARTFPWSRWAGAPLCCAAGLLTAGASRVVSTGSRHGGLHSRDTCAQYLWLPGSGADSVVVATGLAALEPVGSSWIRSRTRVSCIGRQDALPLSRQGSPRCEILCKMLRRSSLILTSFCKARLLPRLF